MSLNDTPDTPHPPDVPDDAPDWVRRVADLGARAITAAGVFAATIVTMIVLVAVNANGGGGGGGETTTTTTPDSTETVAPITTPTPSTTPPAALARLDNPGGLDLTGGDLTQDDLTALAFTTSDPYTEPIRTEDNGPSPQGQFRLICAASHWRYDDPIVSPNATHDHLHMFFGNTETAADSTGATLLASGASTCQGGPLNRSAYWMPALLDDDGNPLAPYSITLYYKTHRPAETSELPQGVKMPAHLGPAGQFNSTFPAREALSWGCYFGGVSTQIRNTIPGTDSPACPSGTRIRAAVQFPQCFAVDNQGRPLLTSDDLVSHTYHLERAPKNQASPCPPSHPYRTPQITYLVDWEIPSGGTDGWHLSCDHDSDGDGDADHPGGCLHADWFGAWNAKALTTWHDNCITATRNCSLGQTSTPRRFHVITGQRMRGKLMTYNGPQTLQLEE